VVEIIKAAEADVVLRIETYGSAPYIAEETGMDYELLSSNLCIFSRFPILRKLTDPDQIGTFNFGGVELLMPDSSKMLFFDIWFHYLPDTRLAPINSAEQVILDWENAGSRDDEVRAAIEVLKPHLAQVNDIPIIMGGDFNSHSHLDWTDATKNMYHHDGAVVNWTISRAMTDAGFIDAFRVIHPNPEEEPGTTWLSGWEDGQLNYDRKDRIDYCYYQGERLHVLNAETFNVPPGDTLHFRDREIMYPSDHGFVLVRFGVILD